MIFRKKLAVIDAVQWFKNGDHPLDGDAVFEDGKFKGQKHEGKIVRYFRSPHISPGVLCGKCAKFAMDHGWIDTPDGGVRVCPGDWVITGDDGSHYTCKPEIFKKEYEESK